MENKYSKEQLDLWKTKHEEYSSYMDFPPFTISRKKRDGFMDDVLKEEQRIISKMRSGDEDAFERMFSTVNVKWEDDIEEARLYQKRYGKDYEGKVEAFEKALELEGLDEDSPGVPFGVL
jgi:hypothetical protein